MGLGDGVCRRERGTGLDAMIIGGTVAYVRVARKSRSNGCIKLILLGLTGVRQNLSGVRQWKPVQCWMANTWQVTSARQRITSVHQ